MLLLENEGTKMKIKYIYSACLEIATSDITILTDPWFTKGAYDGTWYQFPEIDPFAYISGPDYIYISHMHPDHYDPRFLHRLFDRFGVIPILIPDLKNNYLLCKGKSDGLTLTPTRYLDLGGTEIYIEENDTGSISDIDSAMIIHDKINRRSCLNLNDCIFNQSHVEKLQNIICGFSENIDLLALAYTGAGPFPQTYFDLNTEKNLLLEKAKIKKQQFFDRYLRYTDSFQATHHMPFAGEYILGGKLVELNKYRGVSDAFEVTEFDQKALVFNTGGHIDLVNNNVVDIRGERHSQNDLNKKLKEIEIRQFDYETDFSLPCERIDFFRLLKKAAVNALIKAELKEQYYFIFSITENDKVIQRFSCNCMNAEIVELNVREEIKYDFYSDIFIDYRCLFGLITTVYHWNNAEVGSIYFTKRYPIDNYDIKANKFLNFFSIA